MKSLLTLFFFIFLAVANAYADSSPMEQEIMRELNQIQELGESKWSDRISMEKEKQKEQDSKNETVPYGEKFVLN